MIDLSGGFPDAADCPPLYDVVTGASGTAHLVVAAAGNDGEARDNFPAAFPHVISVAASTADDRVSGFSTSSLGIDLAAPAESIPAAVPVARDPTGYLTADGTSLAAPLVSAAAAWAWTVREQELGDVTRLFELIRARATSAPRLGARQRLRRPPPALERRPRGVPRQGARSSTRNRPAALRGSLFGGS